MKKSVRVLLYFRREVLVGCYSFAVRGKPKRGGTWLVVTLRDK
jgi:hypothetical protein